MDKFFLNEQRCKCGKLLLKGVFLDATIEIKCKKCGTMNRVDNFYIDIDKNGIIKYISPSMKKILKFHKGLILNKNYFDFVSPGKREESKKTFKSFLKIKKPYQTKGPVCLNSNTEMIYSELFFTPNYNDVGKLVGYRILVWAVNRF